jgi:hypothetical protein
MTQSNNMKLKEEKYFYKSPPTTPYEWIIVFIHPCLLNILTHLQQYTNIMPHMIIFL